MLVKGNQGHLRRTLETLLSSPVATRLEDRRDVTYGGDRSQTRSGTLPQVMAALRNTAIGLMRLAGRRNVAAAGRYDAARPFEVVALLRFPAKN